MANYQNIWIDYYEVLSVDRTSSKDEIKKSYKKLARDNHPDLHPEAEQNEYKEKLQLINEAYDVLSNDEKRKEYDYMYDERKNRLADTDFPTAEDIQKEMTEEEKRWAEILAFQEIIKEELKKVNIIIDSISEITYWAYSEEVEKFDYYDKYKELESISYEYFRSLNELSEKAYEYDLLDEIHVINNTIDYVKEQLANLPTNPTDARKLYEETNKKQSVTDLIKKHINNTNNIISQLDSIIEYVSRNEITRTEYSIILKSIKLDVQSNISSLTNLAKVATLLNMEKDSDICINHISELQTKIDDIPEEYEDAIKYAEAIKITKECNRLYNKYNTFLWDTVKRKISYLENNIDIDDWYEIYDEITSDITKVESGLIKIKNEFNKLSKFSKNDDLEKLYNDAIKNFLEADKLHVKTRKIYFTIKENNKKLTQDDLIDLFNGTTSYYDKCKAIELLIEITKLKIKTKKYDKLNKEIDTLEDLISQLSGNIDYFKQSKHHATRMRSSEKERQEQLKFLQKKIDEYSSQLSEEKDNWAKSKIKFTSFLSKTKELAKEGIVLSSAGICSISIAIPQGIAVLTRNGYHEFSSVALAILFTMGGIATTAMAKKSFKDADSYKSKYNEEINIYAKHEANCKKLEREIDYYTRKKQKY